MSDVYEALGRIIGEELDGRAVQLNPEMELADIPGWDSAALAGVILGIETTFGVAIHASQIRRISTAGDLAKLCPSP